jgi:hypothetical protein
VNKIESLIVKNLNQDGYDVNINFSPMSGAKGEYYLYVIKDEKKSIVFSNSKKHQSEGAVYAGGISDKNFQNVIEKILN